jgi:MOSC domain-containing protein YiiM
MPNILGSILEINLASDLGQVTITQEKAKALPGLGLFGDRKCKSKILKGAVYKRQITFIEIEQICRFNDFYGLEMKPSDTRRNVVTQGVDLNELVAREFKVGDVRMRGTELCEPCKYLQDLTGLPVVEGYLNRGGLCAEILSHGYINVGDKMELY